VAIVFVTHDLGIVAKMCDQMLVMYAGRAVEQGPVRRIFAEPAHPYSEALLRSVPRMGSRERLYRIEGQPPNLADLPPGCAFAPRCPRAEDRCREEAPQPVEMGPAHVASCLRLTERVP
jgi:oligopeptide/dipeptide ABC transporter ATP-binding protein